MRLRFFHSDKLRERDLAAAFVEGALKYGVKADCEALSATPDLKAIDVACFVGVKSKRLFNACLDAGVVPIICDKGYIRTRRSDSRVWQYWRIAVGAHHPTASLAKMSMPDERWIGLEISEQPWRRTGLQIVIAGSSAKYHDFYDLPEPTEWAQGVVEDLRKFTDRPIVYRPKPSWDGAVPIKGTHFSGPNEGILDAISNAWALITHGSNACFEAAIDGIPSIVLGNGVAKPISSTELSAVNEPMMVRRKHWFSNLAHFQYTESEFRSGAPWPFIRGLIDEYRAGLA